MARFIGYNLKSEFAKEPQTGCNEVYEEGARMKGEPQVGQVSRVEECEWGVKRGGRTASHRRFKLIHGINGPDQAHFAIQMHPL